MTVSAYTAREINATFPVERLASVTITLRDGRVLESGITRATGGPDPQPSEAEVVRKFHDFADPVIGAKRSKAIVVATLSLPNRDGNFSHLLETLLEPL